MSFPSKAPDEIILVTFDFSPEMPTTLSVISNQVVVVTLVASGSGSVSDISLGTSSIDGQTVKVLVSAGLEGNKYRLSCEVDVDNGEHRRIDKDLPVAVKGVLITK